MCRPGTLHRAVVMCWGKGGRKYSDLCVGGRVVGKSVITFESSINKVSPICHNFRVTSTLDQTTRIK